MVLPSLASKRPPGSLGLAAKVPDRATLQLGRDPSAPNLHLHLPSPSTPTRSPQVLAGQAQGCVLG